MADGSEDSTETEEWNLGAQVVGWTSAALYLGSRVPQIALNMKTRCVGLSLLMFAYVITAPHLSDSADVFHAAIVDSASSETSLTSHLFFSNPSPPNISSSTHRGSSEVVE